MPAPQNRGVMNTHSNRSRRRRIASGFTLIELMIAVLIVGVLVAVALPSFLDSIRKSRRSEAFTALTTVQQLQERYRANNAQYADTLLKLNLTAPTPSGYYSVALTTPSATGYVATAEAVGGTQVNDTQCRKLSVQVFDGAIKYAGCNNCANFNYAPTDPCWTR